MLVFVWCCCTALSWCGVVCGVFYFRFAVVVGGLPTWWVATLVFHVGCFSVGFGFDFLVGLLDLIGCWFCYA